MGNCRKTTLIMFACLAAALGFRLEAGEMQPVGWRGDGTGKFPEATPPLTWSFKDGKGTNIVWQTRMPLESPSSVIVVGEKLFTTGNNFELICVDKRTGKILWARPVSTYDAATKEEREANKEVFDKLDPMAQKRDELLAKIPAASAAVSNEIARLGEEIAKNDTAMMYLLAGTDKVKYTNTGVKEGGYMAGTPASDGKLVYAWNSLGVTACFDLDGNRKWIRFDRLTPQEHGHYFSPLVMDKVVIICLGQQYLALEKATGKEAWRTELQGLPAWHSSIVGTVIGGENVLVDASLRLIRFGDKQPFAEIPASAIPNNPIRAVATPVVGGGYVFCVSALKQYSLHYYQLPRKADAPFTPVLKGRNLLTEGSGFMTSSMIYHDGLLYIIGANPVLFVYDVVAEKPAYRQALDFGEEPKRTDRPYGCGICASPAFAGGKIFITGNFGTTIVLEPGRAYKELARNTIDRRIKHAYKDDMREGFTAAPFFEGERLYYRAQRYLYGVGAR